MILNKVLLLILLTISKICFAADFYLLTDTTEITENSAVVVTMNIIDAKLNQAIDLAPIEKNFKILNNSEYRSYSIINGRRESILGFKYTIVPKTTGELLIPALTIDTTAGPLTSLPIKFTVKKLEQSKLNNNAPSLENPVTIHAKAFTDSQVFTGQPFVLQYKIKSLRNVDYPNMRWEDIENAKTARLDISKEYRLNQNGRIIKVTDLYLLITPLKSGKFVIPELSFQGQISKDRLHSGFFTGGLFSEPTPVFARSKKITLNIEELPEQPKPWLGAKSLKLTATLPNDLQPKYAEPFTYKLELDATGVLSEDLPSLSELIQGDLFKVYTDTPKLSQNVLTNGDIVSKREEIVTIVPNLEGAIVLPEIKVNWYNYATGNIETASVAATELFVSTAKQQDKITAISQISSNIAGADSESQVPELSAREKVLIIAVIFLLFGILAIVVAFMWYIKSKLNSKNDLATKTSINKTKVDKFKQNLLGDNINPATILREEILQFAHKKLKVPADIKSDSLYQYLQDNNYKLDSRVKYVFEQLDSMIYSQNVGDCTRIRSVWDENKSGIKLLKAKKIAKRDNLNPT